MKALIRADASVDIGMGHRVRCQALIQAFQTLGWSCQFVVLRRYAEFASQDDIIVESETEFLALARQVDLVILDHYQYQAQDIKRLYEYQPNLLVLDDMNDRGDFPARWLLNPLQELYSSKVLHPLLGSEFALLRPEFLKALSTPNYPQTLLITLGGTDPLKLTLPILEALLSKGFAVENIQVLLGKNAKNADAVKAFSKQHQIKLEHGLSDVTPLMKRAKLAISAAGGTLFELACLGVPTVFAQVADNQTRSLEQHVPKGWCQTLRFDLLDPTQHKEQINSLADLAMKAWSNEAWLHSARDIASKLVDGKGAQRVAQQIHQDLTTSLH